MADKKISALTAATTPLAGTEVLPIVQGGSTVKVSAANLTAGRDISTTGITVSSNTGNIELNWAAGSTHKVGSTFSTAYFTGMRVDADSRNTDIVSFDASGIGNVRIRTGVTETTQLNVDPTGNVTVSTGNLVVGTAAKGIDFSANGGDILTQYDEGTWTPVVTAAVGSVTTYTAEGSYTRIGRMVTACAKVIITVPGTADFSMLITLPFTPVGAGFSGSSCETALTGFSGKAFGANGDPNMYVTDYANGTYFAAGATVYATLTYFV
jgi:hypothetical protein